jgi:hypothetical protein
MARDQDSVRHRLLAILEIHADTPPVHATSPPRVPPFSLGPVDTQTHTDTTPATGLISPLRDMYSSSSSSEPPEGSYLLPSASADPQDPYARFWARLENMLEDISLPRALATAPLDVLKGPPSPPRVTKSKGRNRSE